MFKNFLIICFVCLSLACKQEPKSTQLQIEFKPDSTGFVFLNIENSSLLLIKDLIDKAAAEKSGMNLVSVFQINPAQDNKPAEEQRLAEEAWPGHLKIENNQLVFVPDKAFEPGKEYLVETFVESSFGDMKAILTGQLGHKPKVKTFTLKR